MTLIIPLLILAITATEAPLPQPSAAPGSAREQAQAQAVNGHNQLHLGRLADAQNNCDAALKLDPSNEVAKDCLDLATSMLVDQDLNNAHTKLVNSDKAGALALASKWAGAGASDDQRRRAWQIIAKARGNSLYELLLAHIPTWLWEFLITIAVLATFWLFLLGTRKLWREYQRGRWCGKVPTKWSMIPLRELPATDAQTGIPTDATLDALSRLGHELKRELWQPRLLLLRPTPPADYEPAVITNFLSDQLRPVILAPAADDLRLEWQLHEVQLDQAIQSLQIKTAAGIDIGSVARFMRSIFEWVNAGAPKIDGVAQVVADKSASIHLAAHGGPLKSIAVTASTDFAPGIDPIQLSAERAAVKFLLRMRYPCLTNDQIDGFSALRQGACQFAQYAGTVPSAGDDAKTRTSSLAKAAFNFGFFRASIPPSCAPESPSEDCPSITVTDDLRQAVLLAEGVAHALVGEDEDRLGAIDCFRQLEDWPGSSETELLRQQAKYNEATVWRQMGHPGRCVLMLTELLDEIAPDLKSNNDHRISQPQKPRLQEPIRLPARVARLAAFATYSRREWIALPRGRAELIIDDGNRLVEDLRAIRETQGVSSHDERLATYLYIETLRGIGHAILEYVVTGASDLYRANRPTGLKDGRLDEQSSNLLERGIKHLRACEELSPSGDLFCDLAEAYLLLRDFTRAEGYARHATLESNTDNRYQERAYYLATESFFLQHTNDSLIIAKKYAQDYKGSVTLEEFKSVRSDLGISDNPVTLLNSGDREGLSQIVSAKQSLSATKAQVLT